MEEGLKGIMKAIISYSLMDVLSGKGIFPIFSN